MDRERQKELLTAYLDRELSPDERATVERSLESSAEARGCLHELEQTSRFLRKLPAQQLEADFANDVLDRLRRELVLRPEPEAPNRSNRRVFWWASGPLAAAAMLVLAVWLNRGPISSPGVSPASNVPAPVFSTTREGDLALTPSELKPTDDDDIRPGDLVAGLTVVDVVRAVEEIKALAVKCDISLDSESYLPTITTPRPSPPDCAWIEIHAKREQAGKLLWQVIEGAANPSTQSSPFRGVIFDKPEILLTREADDRKNSDQIAPGAQAVVSRSGESPPRDNEFAAKESADKKDALSPERVARRAARADSVDTQPRTEAGGVPEIANEQLTKDALQSGSLGQGREHRYTLRVYYGQDSLPAVEKLRGLMQEEPLYLRKQTPASPPSNDRVKVLLQLRQISNPDEPAKKRGN